MISWIVPQYDICAPKVSAAKSFPMACLNPDICCENVDLPWEIDPKLINIAKFLPDAK